MPAKQSIAIWMILILVLSLSVFETRAARAGQDEDGFEEMGRFRTLGPTHFLSIMWSHNPLGLTDELKAEIRQLMFDPATNGPRLFDDAEQHQRTFDQIMALLNPDQQLMLRQIVRFNYYERAVSKHYREVAAYSRYFCWLHPDLAKLIDVQDDQVRRSLQAIKECKEQEEERKREHHEFLGNLYEEWQTELLKILLPRQKQQFHDTLGQPFAFGANIRPILKTPYASDYLPLFLQPNPVEFGYSGSVEPWHLLLIGQQRLDGHMNLHAETTVLLATEVKSELRLSDSQVDRIKELQSEYIQRYPIPQALSIGFRERGVAYRPAPERTFGKAREAKEETGQDLDQAVIDPEVQSLRDRLQVILDTKQRERWRQLSNQIVLGMGWIEVPLTFPDWPSYLELSEAQIAQFNEIHREREAHFAAEQTAYFQDINASRAQVNAVPQTLLTPQQLAILQVHLGIDYAGE